MVPTPSFVLPRDAGEERGGGFEQLERFERSLRYSRLAACSWRPVRSIAQSRLKRWLRHWFESANRSCVNKSQKLLFLLDCLADCNSLWGPRKPIMKKILALILSVIFVASCGTAPYTGRSQVILVSEGQEASLGDDAYRHHLRDSVVTHDAEAERIVRKVGERIARAANKPEYKWEFTVINDPEMVNAFAVPGGKVAVYTGIFVPARDEAGLAVVLGHEVAHALARHPAERMSQGMLLQLGGVGLGVALGRNPALANQVLQAYGITAGVGVALPFSRSQETEADRIGLILMAKAGYDPRVALELWERMEKKGGKGAPPEFLSTHPGYETRIQQLRSFLPEALGYYQAGSTRIETLPSAESLDTSTAKSERELLKRLTAINRFVAEQSGERPVVEALAYELRTSPQIVFQERQQLRVGYGQYAALRGVSYLGRGSINRVVEQYQRGLSWSEITSNNGSRLNELTAWIEDVMRTTSSMGRQLRNQQPRPSVR
jgi:metalloendopeptidase OMA1, mitochondrial